MKTYGGSRGIAPPFLTSALDWGEWSASRPDRFNPGERAPGTHWKRGWMGYRASFDAVEKWKISFPCRLSNPAVQSVACRYTDWAILTRPGIYLEGLRKTIKTSTKVLGYRSGLEPSTTQIRFHNVTDTLPPQVYRILHGAGYRKGLLPKDWTWD
jgi:hypothetical protein